MEEEKNTLDGYLSDTALSDNQSTSISTEPAPRPKLKKIKRPKIRPMTDTPVAPQKVYTDSQTDISGVETQSSEQTLPTETGTSLMTSSEANSLSQNIAPENSYILGDLPPELDYMTDENGIGIYNERSGSIQKIVAAAILFFLIGAFLGAFFFSSKTDVKQGLEDVVLNPDVPQGRARCGLTEKSQACVFYVMNCYKQELTGRDFYKLAATLTGREEYTIEDENMRYSNIKIKPGAFAQLNIPALK